MVITDKHQGPAICDLPKFNPNHQDDARLIAAAPKMLEALMAIEKNPYGCPFCDSGVLRNKEKGHEPDCGYELARLAIAEARGEK